MVKISSKSFYGFEEIFTILVEAILVGIEMCGTDAHGVGAIDLRAKLQLDLVGVDFWGSVPIVLDVAVLVYEARDLIFRRHTGPTGVSSRSMLPTRQA